MLRASRTTTTPLRQRLGRTLQTAIRPVSTTPIESSKPVLVKNDYIYPSLVEDLKKNIHLNSWKSVQLTSKSFNEISPQTVSSVPEERKKEVAWSSSYDPVTRSPFAKDVVHLQSLLDALLASKNFDRADKILRSIYSLLGSADSFVPLLNKYLEAYAAEESTTIEDLETYTENITSELNVQSNDRTYALLIGKALSNPEKFDKWVNLAKKSRHLFRSMLNNVDVITIEGLTKIFKDPTLNPSYVPQDLLAVYNEVRSPGEAKEEDFEDTPKYFSNENVEAPALEKDDAVMLRSVDSFGMKVIRHTLLGLKSENKIDVESLFKDLDGAVDSHLLHNLSDSKRNCHEIYKKLKTPEDRAKFNQILEIFNERRQKDLEARGIEGARAKWNHEFNTLQQRGEISMNKNLNVQLYKWYSDMLSYVEEEYELCSKLVKNEIQMSELSSEEKKQMKERSFYAPYLILVPPKTLTVITIFELLKLNSTGGIVDGMRAARAVISVGRAVELEYKCKSLMKADKKYAVKKGMNSSQWRKVVKSRKSIEANSVQTEWTQPLYAKLGSVLTTLLLHVAKVQVTGTDPATGKTVKGLQPAFHHTYQFFQGQRIGVIKLHKNLVRQLGGNAFINSVQPSFLPMLVPPRPWTSHNVGGYLFTPSNVVRTKDSAETMAYVKAASDAHNLDEVYKGLNILGETAWTVNSKVLDIISQCWNTGEQFLDIPPVAEDPKLPPPLPADADPSVRSEHISKIKAILHEAAGNRSQRCDINYKLEIARAFVGEKMYFPHSVDFRGRAYPISPHLNHLGSDLTRSLFLFWDGAELGERGLRWLKIHLANVYGKDKAPLEERVQFVEDNLENIFQSARDPLGPQRWWMNSEKPWQVLSVCFELNEAYKLDDPTKYVSHIPVHQDGTCNGLQHYAALGGDIEGARQVNLIPADRPQDVYRHVALLVEKRLEEEAAEGNEFAIFLKGKISRKVVKQTVMTNVYGVTFVGAVAQIEKQLGNLFKNEDSAKISDYARYLTAHVFASVRELFEGAHLIQDWLGEAAKRISKSVRIDYEDTTVANANKPNHLSSVIWTTPLGLPCVQPYRANKHSTVSTSLQDVSIMDPFGASQVDARKQQAAFPPNFVHSLDATHMLMTAKACGEDGLSFASVHDSYWTHARDVDIMNKNIRDQFVKLHEEDSIQKLKEEFERRYKGFLQVMSIPGDHDVAIKIKELRKGIVKDLGRALTVADEIYLEKKRQELLDSSNPADVELGKKMTTTVSLTEGYDMDKLAIPASSPNSFQILTRLEFPEIPKKGDLDVKVVRDSPYFFS